MKTEQLLDLALDFAKDPENIENGLVNWDFVGADIYLHVGAAKGGYLAHNLDPEMVEAALAAAKALA